MPFSPLCRQLVWVPHNQSYPIQALSLSLSLQHAHLGRNTRPMGSGWSSQKGKTVAAQERERKEKEERAQRRRELLEKQRDTERRQRAAKEAWLNNYRMTTPRSEGFLGRLIDWWKEKRAWARHTAGFEDGVPKNRAIQGEEMIPLTSRPHQDWVSEKMSKKSIGVLGDCRGGFNLRSDLIVTLSFENLIMMCRLRWQTKPSGSKEINILLLFYERIYSYTIKHRLLCFTFNLPTNWFNWPMKESK